MYLSITMATIDLSSIASNSSPVVKGLQSLLSATISLTSSTQSAHWNFLGANFSSVHAMFGSQYDELFDAQDVLAERIRALRGFPLAECAGTPVLTPPFSAQECLSFILKGREEASAAFKMVAKIARDNGDATTENMLLSFVEAHDKAAWMIRSHMV